MLTIFPFILVKHILCWVFRFVGIGHVLLSSWRTYIHKILERFNMQHCKLGIITNSIKTYFPKVSMGEQRCEINLFFGRALNILMYVHSRLF